jgi:hypothetical protein
MDINLTSKVLKYLEEKQIINPKAYESEFEVDKLLKGLGEMKLRSNFNDYCSSTNTSPSRTFRKRN